MWLESVRAGIFQVPIGTQGSGRSKENYVSEFSFGEQVGPT